jgi:hypothetical protein
MSHVWGTGEVHTGFWCGDLRERDHLEDPGVDGENNIKMYLQEVGWGGIDWIDLAQDTVRWRALVTVVINLRDP